MKLAIIGSREFDNYELLENTIRSYFFDEESHDISEIISGGAKGADSLGAKFAKEHNLKLTEYLPNWDLHGKKAGFLRNRTIVENCDILLAFWTGTSKGTANSLSIAKELKKITIIVYF